MPNPPYRTLRIILGIFPLFTAAAVLLFILSSKPLVMRILLRLSRLKFPLCCSFEPGRETRKKTNMAIRERTHCESLHFVHNAVAVALYAGHSPTLSELPNLDR